MTTTRVFRLVPLICLAVLIGCAGGDGEAVGGGGDPGPPRVDFVLDEAAFDQPPRSSMVVFDVVSADMDQDGDPDVLINWHNLAPLELYDNIDGSFARLNPDVDDRSGLFENPGVPRLYAAEEDMISKVRRAETAGVFLWHDPSPRGDWHVSVVPGDDRVTLELRANGALQPRLDERFVRSSAEFGASLDIDTELHFRVGVELVATQLAVTASLPIFAGPDLTPVGPDVSLWKDDPHGIAWVHVRGTLSPEVFITRGGLGGSLLPPHDPKRDRFFERVDADLLFEDVSTMVPAGYGRGRRVEWVDVDRDGVNELYIGNTATPNALLARDGADSYVDVAAAHGLDAREGDAFAWLDVDDNGFDDLLFIDESGFSVALNRGGRRFEVTAGGEIGLRFPVGSAPRNEDLFNRLSLNVVDFDSDGRLDLWLTGHGEGGGHALYRGREGGFVDVTAEVGLDTAPTTNSIVLLDRENDGYVDALIFGSSQMWVRNRGGRRFDLERVDPNWGLREFTRGVAVDVDGDALLDVVLAGHRRMVARNTTREAGTALRVLPRAIANDPVGTMVTAVYAGGMRRVQRYGSALTTRYSQGLAPLHFGIPAGDAIERLVVRWPDGDVEERVVDGREDLIELLH